MTSHAPIPSLPGHESSEPLSWTEIGGACLAFTDLTHGNLALHVGDDPDAVFARRARLAEAAGVRAFTFMHQTHSASVVSVDDDDATGGALTGDPIVADSLVSRHAPLGVLVADCVPVLLVARSSSSGPADAIAAAHAGRAGVLSGILEGTVERLRDEAPGATIRAVIGPCVCAGCYEVPEDMASDAEAMVPGIRSSTRWGTPSLDLPGAARRQLEALGVEVESSGVCTMESEKHSSHRRDPGSGRIAGLIWVPGSDSREGGKEGRSTMNTTDVQDTARTRDTADVQYTAERQAELAERLAAVRGRIARACAEAGRADEPTLIVVTKNFPASDAAALADLGVADMGENRDQEAKGKAAALAARGGEQPLWHFIGQLQTNKAKSVVQYAETVHSIDRPQLVSALDRAMERALNEGTRAARATRLSALIQVSLDPGAEAGRGGVQPEGMAQILEALDSAEHLDLRGIMAVAPLGMDAAEAFGRLAGIHARLVKSCPSADWVSAGMSQDLEEAVRHGATHVRIGSDVLGQRAYVG